jgi:hypothetical protein
MDPNGLAILILLEKHFQMKLQILHFNSINNSNKLLGIIIFILIFCSGKLLAQIQPDQIGFPPDSTQIWVLGSDTTTSSPSFGRGIWYNAAQLILDLDTLAEIDHDWYGVGTTLPPVSISDPVFRSGSVGINISSPSEALHVQGRGRIGLGTNLLLGESSGNFTITGTENILIGKNTGNTLTSGNSNTSIGEYSGRVLTSGSNNTFIGARAGYSTTTGINNFYGGSDSGNNNLGGSYNVGIGHGALQESDSADFNIALGWLALRYVESYANIGIGKGALANTVNSTGVLGIGFQSGLLYGSGSNTVMLGTNSGYQSTGSNNILIGASAGSEVNGDENIAIGSSSLNESVGNRNIGIGNESMQNFIGNEGIAIGQYALQDNISGENNTAVGNFVLRDATSGGNTGLGSLSLQKTISGGNNTGIGYASLLENTTGGWNTSLGSSSGQNGISGSNNLYLGVQAGYGATSNDADNNVALGFQSGLNITGDGNVFLGYASGQNETGSNKLYIENSASAAPLLYGEFDNDLIKINGKSGYTTNGGTPTTLSGRDGTYFSDVSTGYGLTLTSGILKLDTTNLATQYDIGQVPISTLKPATGTNTINNGNLTQEWQWNSLGGGSGLKISSVNTSATGNSQKLVEVTLSGSNATSFQQTAAGYFSNLHTGSAPVNYGVHGVVSNSVSNLSAGVMGEGSTGVFGQSGAGGVGVRGIGTTAVLAQGASGIGLSAIATSGIGVSSIVSSGTPILIADETPNTNSVEAMMLIHHTSSGTVANGFGGSIDFLCETGTGPHVLSNSLISKWTNATDNTRTSQFSISGVNNATTAELLTLSGNGAIKFNKYGIGNYIGTATKWLAVDASGNIIEEDTPGGGDDWGTQSVETDITLTGNGTSGNILKVDTSLVATQNYVDLLIDGLATYYYLTSDFTTTSGSAVTITGLSFTPQANKKYLISGKLLLRTSNASVGAKVGMNWPTAGVVDNGGSIRAANSTSSTSNSFFIGTTNGQTNASATFSNTTQSHMAEIQDAYLIMGSSPSGNYSATMKSNGSVTMTCKAGSYIKVEELPF